MANIKSETVHQNAHHIWGEFKLSDGTTTKFEMVAGGSWFQWGNSTENLCLTGDRVQELTDAWIERFNVQSEE